MKTTENEIQLTAVELEMIKLQREKAELEQKEKELKHKQNLDKRVEDCEKEITNGMLLLHKQREAAENYFLDLELQKKGMFKLIEKKYTFNKQVIDYVGDDRVVYWEKTVDDIEYKIGVIGEKYTIAVAEHKVYSSKWSRYATNKGFHMFLHGAEWKDENKAIKSAKTMVTKIEGYIEDANFKKKSVDRAELAKEMALARLQSEFPDLSVKYEKNWVRSTYSKDGGYYENRILITLENNKTFKFSYNLLNINNEDILKIDLDGWAGFDYVEVIGTIRTLKQVNQK